MKLINRTKYRSDDLRKLISAAHFRMHAPVGKTVEVRQGRSRHHGRAALSGGWMMISLPPPGHANVTEVARVLEHEIAHNLGVTHEEMDEAVKYCTQEVPWANGLELRAKTVKAAPTMEERIAARADKARAMLARWDRKVRLAKTMRAKWQVKVRYYERKAAAGGQKEE